VCWSLSRAPVTVLFSILLLISFGLTQNVSADEAVVFQSCANNIDGVSFSASAPHSVSATVNFDEVTVVANGGQLDGGGIGGRADEAVFFLDGLTGSPLSDRASGDIISQISPPVVTFTNLTPGPHTITVCYIERTLNIFGGGISRVLTHTDSVDFSGPPEPLCGDGVVNQPTEQCDPAPAGSLPTATCNANCQNIPFCGDGAINQLTEQCEDPNLPTATCDINCQIIVPPPPVCGDGVVNQAIEQCDPAPAGSLPTATCDIDCQNIVAPPTFSCGLGTTPNVITNECDPDVTQAQLDIAESLRDAALAALAEAQAQRDAILATLFEFLRVFGVI